MRKSGNLARFNRIEIHWRLYKTFFCGADHCQYSTLTPFTFFNKISSNFQTKNVLENPFLQNSLAIVTNGDEFIVVICRSHSFTFLRVLLQNLIFNKNRYSSLISLFFFEMDFYRLFDFSKIRIVFFFFEVLISHLLRSSLSFLVNERELLGNIPLVKKSITKIQYKKAYIELGA